jgi:hypothetical protein
MHIIAYNIDWFSFKFVSDDATSKDATKTWQADENDGQKLFLEKLKEFY